MAGLPAKCRNCGLVFEDCSAVDLAGEVRSFTLGKGRVKCPVCHGPADVGGGTYSYTDGKLVLDRGPASTQQMMRRLQGIAQRAKEEDLTVEEILAEVAEVNPELAKKLKKKRLSAVVLVVLLILIVKSCAVSVEIDLNGLIDQAYHLSQGQDPIQHLGEETKRPSGASSGAKKPTAKARQRARTRRERQARKRARRRSQ